MALSDIEIARQAKKRPIKEIAQILNLDENSLHPFGHFTAKITSEAVKKLPEKISVLQTQILNYQTTLEDPDLFRSNLKLFESTVAVLKAAQTDLAAAEEEWLRLELRREELEST